jgi:phage FluMu protein Com
MTKRDELRCMSCNRKLLEYDIRGDAEICIKCPHSRCKSMNIFRFKRVKTSENSEKLVQNP